MLVELVRDAVLKYGLFEYGDKILIGVSGGHDSVALFHILKELSKEENYSLHIAHINHGMRGTESDGDEEYVREMAEGLSIPFYSKRVDMNLYAKEQGLSPEEAGREIRYSFFREIVNSNLKGGKIAVAHNKNDQAETVLMRMMRGTGIDGLKGMDYISGNIVRPLLKVSRAQIESYCESEKLEPRTDSSNLENVYSRNKVRLELIPYIEDNFNPNIIETLERMSNIIRKDSDYIDRLSEKAYKNVCLDDESGIVVLDNNKFKELEDPIRYRVARKSVLKVLGKLEGLEEKHLNILVDFSDRSKTGKSIDLLKGVVAKINYNKLSLEKSEKKDEIRYNYRVEIGKTLKLEELGGYLKSEVFDIEDVFISGEGRYKKHFDYDSIEGEIYVRSRLDGDRVRLKGMSGRKKLKDYYIDEKIPKEKRAVIPLVEMGGEIVWIVGYRSGEKAEISSSTKRVLLMEYFENEKSKHGEVQR